ncbi:MAG: hypothetical protein WD512_01835, partial [Candidatus Paceibacterota bacterium]
GKEKEVTQALVMLKRMMKMANRYNDDGTQTESEVDDVDDDVETETESEGDDNTNDPNSFCAFLNFMYDTLMWTIMFSMLAIFMGYMNNLISEEMIVNFCAHFLVTFNTIEKTVIGFFV